MSKFKQLGLSKEITDALEKIGYQIPTEIQEKTIPAILNEKNDIKAFAQTGTGKTAAFSLPIIEQIDTESKQTQAIILSPTRELALQIAKNIQEFSKNIKELKTVCVYGGSNIDNQIKDLKKGAQIVVGTPGRTVDLIKRSALKLHNIKWVVLDEADEMLNMGFKEDLDIILEETPNNKQTFLFSATFPKEVEAIAKNYMNKPIEISAGKKNIGADTVEHELYVVPERQRYATLKRIVDMNIDMYGIIFCRTRRETQEISDKLIQDGYTVDSLHGDLSQAQRDLVMRKFRSKKIQILVATDVAARGIDVNELTHVINHRLPDQIESYTHRSGRTGRAGSKGISVVIINGKEQGKIRQIERIINKKFIEKEVPKGKDIVNAKLDQYVAKIKNLEVDSDKMDEHLKKITSQLKRLTKDELIKRFVYIEFESLLNYYNKEGDIQRDNKDFHTHSNNKNMQRFFVNLGKKDNLNPARIIGMINETLDKKIEIGQIEILKNFSFFEADKNYTDEILDAFKGVTRRGRNVSVEKTEQQKNRSRNGNRSKNRKKNGKKRKINYTSKIENNVRGFKRRTEKSTRKRKRKDY